MMISRSMAGLVALIASAVMASPSLAQTGDDVAQRCIQTVGQIAQESSDTMDGIADRTGARLAALDDRGAPDRVLIRAAKEGASRVEGVERRAQASVRRTVRVCVERLRNLGADRSLIESVLQAGQRASTVIERSAEANQRAIRRVLASELND